MLASRMVRITPGRSLSSAATPEVAAEAVDPPAAVDSGFTPEVISKVLASPAAPAPASLVGLNHPGVSDILLARCFLFALVSSFVDGVASVLKLSPELDGLVVLVVGDTVL